MRLRISPLSLARRAATDRTALVVAALALVLGVGLGLSTLAVVALVVGGWVTEIGLRLALEASAASRPRLWVNANGPEGQWLARCEQSVKAIEVLARSAPRGPIADRCRSIAGEAAISIDEIHRIAGRASQVGTMLVRIAANRRVAEEALLAAEADGAGSDSLRAQQEVHQRLSAAGVTAVARVRTASVALDALVARMAEIVALADEGMPAAAGMAADNLGQLAQEMESLRAGLAETNSELMEMS